MSTLNARLTNPVGTADEWTAENPTLLAGEIGVESDTGKFKVGDGTTAWTGLDYAQAEPGTTAHGDLTGLDADDHPQYLRVDSGDYVASTALGEPDGVASLDGTGKVPEAQLPASSGNNVGEELPEGAFWLLATEDQAVADANPTFLGGPVKWAILDSSDVAPTAAPANFTFEAANDTRIDGSYDAVQEATGYEYVVQTGSQSGDPVGQTPVDVGASLSFEASDLEPDTLYTGWVRAYNAEGPGPWSAPVEATTLEAAALDYDATVLADTPVRFWSVAETTGSTIIDEVESQSVDIGLGATLGASGPTAEVPNAIEFDGTSGFELGVFGLNTRTPFTFEGVFRFAGNAYLIAQQMVGTTFPPYLAHGGLLGLSSGNTGISVRDNGSYSNAQSTLATDTWHHIVAVSTGTDLVLYRNGVQVGTAAWDAASSLEQANNTSAYSVGARTGNTSDRLVGFASKIAFYDYALDATQAAAHATAAGMSA